MDNIDILFKSIFQYQKENRGEYPKTAFMNIEKFVKLKDEIFEEIKRFTNAKFNNNGALSIRGVIIIPFYEQSDEIYFSDKPFKFK